jgi:hypothetical protein
MTMDKDIVIIAAILGGLWLYTKRKAGTKATAGVTTTEPTKAVDAESWMGAWGLGK